VGGGGFTSGIDIAPDGTAVARIDVYGTYKYNSGTSRWDLLDTAARMPAGVGNPGGGIEIRVAPSNTSIIYKWMNDGKLYRTLNGGTTFVQLVGFGTHDSGAANGGTGIFDFPARLEGYKMAVDPINPDVLYVGTSAGVLVSSNASQGSGSTPTFAATSGITAANSNGPGYLFAFDPSGGSTGGKSNVLYVSSNGQGVFKMTAPGGAFAVVPGGPTTRLGHMVVSPNGVVWAASNATQNAYKLVSGTWTTYSNAVIGVNPKSVVVDPNRSSSSTTEHVILISDGGLLSTTTNSGTAWTAASGFGRAAADVPWLAAANEYYMSASLIAYNRNTDTIWFAEGIGTWTTPGAAVSSNYTWTSNTRGIESLEPQSVVASAGATGRPVLAAWDRAFFGISSIGTYPSGQGTSYASSIISGWGLDWATSNGTTLAGLALWNNDYSGTSTDGGLTWSPFPVSPTSFSTTVATVNSAAVGVSGLTFSASIPSWVKQGALVDDVTHPGAVHAYVQIVNSSTSITLDRAVAAPGVTAGDTIQFGLSGSGQVQQYVIGTATASGAVLHFASLPANSVHPKMTVTSLTNNPSLPNQVQVLSVAGGDVTLLGNVNSAIAIGDVIQFSDAGLGGAIAAASPTNFVQTPSNNAQYPYYTTDGGATWNPIVIAGVPRAVSGSVASGSTTVTVVDSSNFATGASAIVQDSAGFIPGNTNVVSITDGTHIVISQAATGTAATDLIVPQPGWSWAYYLNLKNVAADRVTANKFYLYNFITGRVYASTNSGATWTPVNTTPVNLNTTYQMHGGQNAAMKSVPGNAGHLFMTGANVYYDNGPFIRSIDGGVTWSAVVNVSQVNAFGFGMPKPGGGGYPTVFIWGQVSGVLSLWRSDDNCANWINLGANPAGSLDAPITDLDGDKNIYGQVYGAFSSSGWFYGVLQ
jgi:hypothetical protein